MQYADRVKDTATTTGTGAITLAGSAAAGFRTFGSAFTVGDLIPYCISAQVGGEWEAGVGTLTAATTLARTAVTASSNNGNVVNFPAGVKDIVCTLTAAELEKLAGASSAIVTTVADQATTYLLSVGPDGVPKKITIAALLAAIGVSAPNLTAAGTLLDSDIMTIARADGYSYQTTYGVVRGGVAPGDTTAPTVTAATVADATPTILALTASETLDAGYVPAASAFTVSGHTVSAVAVSGATINLTVDAFVNGEAVRTVAYTQTGTNNIRDTAGNLLANFTGRAITNNVGAVATVPDAPTIGTAVAGDGYVDVYFTRNSNGGSAVIDSTATLSTGETATLASSPIRVTAANGTARTATVKDRNSVGSSAASAASNSVTPAAAGATLADTYLLTAGTTAIPASGASSGGTAPNRYFGLTWNMYIKDSGGGYPAQGALRFFWIRSADGSAPTSLPAAMLHNGTAWPTAVPYTANGGSTGNVPNSVKSNNVNTTTFPGLANPTDSLFGGGSVPGDYYLIIGYADGSWKAWPNKVAVS